MVCFLLRVCRKTSAKNRKPTGDEIIHNWQLFDSSKVTLTGLNRGGGLAGVPKIRQSVRHAIEKVITQVS
jgi:hypothetical protein